MDDQLFWCTRSPVYDETVWESCAPVPLDAEFAQDAEAPVRIVVPHHLPVDLDDCEVGKLVAVSSQPGWHEQEGDDDESPNPCFWIGEITGFDTEENELLLTYYRRSARNPLYFNFAPESTGAIAVSAVLAYGFTLTCNRKVRAVTYKAIARVLDLQQHDD